MVSPLSFELVTRSSLTGQQTPGILLARLTHIAVTGTSPHLAFYLVLGFPTQSSRLGYKHATGCHLPKHLVYSPLVAFHLSHPCTRVEDRERAAGEQRLLSVSPGHGVVPGTQQVLSECVLVDRKEQCSWPGKDALIGTPLRSQRASFFFLLPRSLLSPSSGRPYRTCSADRCQVKPSL